MSCATRAFGAVGVGLVAGVVTLGPVGIPLAAAAPVKAGRMVAATTTVNIRTGPSIKHKIIGQLERGQQITAVGSATGQWIRVRLAGSVAYMSANYLNTTGRRLPASPTRIDTSGIKVTTVTLNVRSGPGMTRRIVGTLAEGTRITLTGKLSRGYAQLNYQGHRRWVSQQYLATLRSAKSVPTPPAGSRGTRALAFARAQLGKPYKWGAEGPKAYDCSGLVMMAWRSVGVSIPRTSQQQFRSGRRILKSQLRAGDLVFFYGSRPSHVAMYVADGVIIQAPRPGRRVEYSRLSNMPYSGAVRPG